MLCGFGALFGLSHQWRSVSSPTYLDAGDLERWNLPRELALPPRTSFARRPTWSTTTVEPLNCGCSDLSWRAPVASLDHFFFRLRPKRRSDNNPGR
jgi:hypothetical protein